jgi:hypothetical protein
MSSNLKLGGELRLPNYPSGHGDKIEFFSTHLWALLETYHGRTFRLY